MNKAITLVLGIMIGGGIATAVNAVWGLPTSIHPFQSKEPVKIAEEYITEVSNGDFSNATNHLTGEAKVYMSKENLRLKPDPVNRTDMRVISQGTDFCEIEAKVTTKADTLLEDLYLTRQSDEWKIFSIQSPTETWISLFAVTLTQDQRSVIQDYAKALANGDVQKALPNLAGQARIRAGEMNIGNNLPKQNIKIEDIKGVGKTNEGVLVQVQERVIGTVPREVTLLYTLSQVGEGWKISDIRTLKI